MLLLHNRKHAKASHHDAFEGGFGGNEFELQTMIVVAQCTHASSR